MQNIQYYNGVIDATGCISNGWNLLKANYWLHFGICLVASIAIAFLSCIPCLNLLIGGLVTAPLIAGIYYVFLRDMRGEPIDFGMMFKGFEKFVPAMIIGFIQSIPGVIVTILQWVLDLGRILAQLSQSGRRGGNFFQSNDADIALAGGLIALYIVLVVVILVFSIAWYITFAFALPLVIEHDIDAIEAIKLSAKAGWGNVGGLIVLLILSFFILLGGALACGIGVFFVLPLYYASFAFAYRQVFPMAAQPSQQAPMNYTGFDQQPL